MIIPTPKRIVTNVNQPWQRGPANNRKRSQYYRRNRPRRTVISILENSSSQVWNRREYRAVRFLYYQLLPQYLFRCIWFRPDRDRLHDIEHDLYNELLAYHFRSDQRRRANRPDDPGSIRSRAPPGRLGPWTFGRSPDCRIQSDNQQKL